MSESHAWFHSEADVQLMTARLRQAGVGVGNRMLQVLDEFGEGLPSDQGWESMPGEELTYATWVIRQFGVILRALGLVP